MVRIYRLAIGTSHCPNDPWPLRPSQIKWPHSLPSNNHGMAESIWFYSVTSGGLTVLACWMKSFIFRALARHSVALDDGISFASVHMHLADCASCYHHSWCWLFLDTVQALVSWLGGKTWLGTNVKDAFNDLGCGMAQSRVFSRRNSTDTLFFWFFISSN